MKQDSENWELLQTLFHLAETTPAGDRERVLAEHCPDPELRRRAMDIFEAANLNGPTANLDPADAAKRVLLDTNGGLLSSRIGPYSLIRHLGSGGLGSVYLVERLVGGVVQRSALKVLAPHAAGPSFVERFNREQHILASLDHPNITRMLDAGLSEAGQPYLVMEYVDGVHLDAYCDAHQLGIAERLQLFLRVCDAVAYAHRNLIVHLDLKPSNILVTAEGTVTGGGQATAGGTVKLLDFGTSKLLLTDSQQTTTVLATPAYASPEQLRNEAVTTACDVYALGVILFELLAGRRPGDSASVAVMLERAMREQEAEHLPDAVTAPAAEKRGLTETRLRQLLRGDLDTIAAKCLSPRPKDRYVSVDALADDIRRFNEGRPILARPQTTIYRLGKFVRRNRGAVTATVLVALALIASLGYAEWRQRQALHEGQRALRMQTFLYRLFKLANSNYTGKPAATVPEFLELGVKVLPEYIKEPADLREAQLSLAESMFDNGDLKNAEKVFTGIIPEARAAGDVSSEAEAEAFAGDIAYQLGNMENGAKLTASALDLSQKAKVSPTVKVWSEIYYAYNRENSGFASDSNLKLLQSAVTESREQHLPDRETAYALYMLASDYEVRGQLPEAQGLIQEAIAIYNKEPYAICDQSEMYTDLAYIKAAGGDPEGSLPLYQKAYDGFKACVGPDNRSTLVTLDFMAGAMNQVGRAKDAVPLLEAAMPAWRKSAGSSPDLANPLHFLANAYVLTGQFAKAEQTAAEEFKVQDGKIKPDDHRMGTTQLVWARSLDGQQKYREALPHAEIADRILAKFVNSPMQKKTSADAHQLVLDIQAKLHS
jgi:serine/threonine protein kinase/tetratricopeptide (TPR) repeat protein